MESRCPGRRLYFPLLYLTIPTVQLEKSLYYSTHPLPKKPVLFPSLFLLFFSSSCFNIFTLPNPNMWNSPKGPLKLQLICKVVLIQQSCRTLYLEWILEIIQFKYFPTAQHTDTQEPFKSQKWEGKSKWAEESWGSHPL